MTCANASEMRTIRANGNEIRECAQNMTPLHAARIPKGRDKVMDNIEEAVQCLDQASRTKEHAYEFEDDTRKCHITTSGLEERAW